MNILLTSIGRRSYLVDYFKDALGGQGKLFVSNSIESIGMKKADGTFITPLIYDPEYIPSILSFCIENDVKIVMSVFDIDLLILARNRDLFAQHGIKIILAEPESVEICNDKWKTFLFLKELGIKTPQSYLSVEETIDSIKRGNMSYPVVIKPRWGMASIGIYTADDEEELRVLSKKCEKEIKNSYLKYESAYTPNESIIYQERLNGQEHGIDVINDLNGNYIKIFCKSKIAMRAGETDLGKTVASLPFEATAQKISQALRHEAICSVDCFKMNDEIYVIEMNCRISGHYPLSHLAGVNLPKQIIKWYNNEGTDDDLLRFKEGLLIAKDLVPIILGGM